MGPALPERSPEDRLDFDPAIRTLTEEEAMDESRRCLQCDLVCNVCTTVCPNRANVALLSLPCLLYTSSSTPADFSARWTCRK